MNTWVLMLGLSLISPWARALCLVCTCTASAQTINFGAYTITANSTVNGTFNVSCTTTVAISTSVTIAASVGSGTSYSSRVMKNGTASLNYNLYTTTPVPSTIWGNGTGGTGTITSATLLIGILQPTIFTMTIYGLIPSSQDVIPGTYNDTLTVTTTY